MLCFSGDESRVRRQAEEDGSLEGTVISGGDMIQVLILVEDIDDNGPSFGKSADGEQLRVVAGRWLVLVTLLNPMSASCS